MSVCWRHQFLQGSWNYERMQNGGWCFAMIPAIKKLYSTPEEQSAALKRHLEFYNTHPYVSAPIIGVTLALEEERANGMEVEDQAIQGVKVGMMGPLAGVGDPVFWFTVRPILGALGASMALGGSLASFGLAWAGYKAPAVAGAAGTFESMDKFMTVMSLAPGITATIAVVIIILFYKLSDKQAAEYAKANVEREAAAKGE